MNPYRKENEQRADAEKKDDVSKVKYSARESPVSAIEGDSVYDGGDYPGPE